MTISAQCVWLESVVQDAWIGMWCGETGIYFALLMDRQICMLFQISRMMSACTGFGQIKQNMFNRGHSHWLLRIRDGTIIHPIKAAAPPDLALGKFEILRLLDRLREPFFSIQVRKTAGFSRQDQRKKDFRCICCGRAMLIASQRMEMVIHIHICHAKQYFLLS